MIEVLPLEKLEPSPDNPRRSLGDITELATSIAAVGLLEPLVVTPNGGGHYVVVCGHRRLAAAKEAGLDELPAIVREFDDAGRMEAALVENLQRSDLDPLDEAEAYRRLVELGYSQRRLAERVGVSQAHVSKRLSLLELPKRARDQLANRKISVADALELTKLAGVKGGVERALKDRWADIPRAVQFELAEHERKVKRQAVIDKLKAQGTRIVEVDHLSFYGRKEKPLGSGYGQIKLTPKAHQAERCHAVAVDEHGRTAPVCTNPSKHPDANPESRGGPLSDEQKAQRARQREHNKVLRSADELRVAAMREVLGRKVAMGDALELVAAQWIRESDDRNARIAAELLDLAVEDNGYGRHRAALLTYAAQGPEQRTKAVVALAFGVAEHPIRTNRFFGDRSAAPHYEWLGRHGWYEPSEAERSELNGHRGT